MITAILFDLDDTLMDRRATIGHWLPGHCERLNLPAHLQDAYRKRFYELDADGYTDRQSVFAGLAAEFPMMGTADVVREDFRAKAWDRCTTFPGAFDLLKSLRKEGLKLGVITNGSSRVQRAKVENLKLAEFVDTILISQEEGIHKPAPEIFQRAVERLNVRLEAAVFVGDNPVADVQGAAQAGLTAIWARRHLAWPADVPSPVHAIDSLIELPGLIASLSGHK